MDIHSWSRPDRVRLRHLELDLEVRFDRKVLEGAATLHYDRFEGQELTLDTRDLAIHSVDNAAGFSLGAADPILGTPLRIQLLPGATWVRVRYSTSPHASGLQWLEPPQTAGRSRPFLYTQSQAIHARSWIPIQDTPGVRLTFEAAIRVPQGLRAVMGASLSEGGRFRMDHPVPSYLIALAAGDLAFQPLGPRSGVYAEPALLPAAAHEFADTEAMIAAVEEMYGPYRWGRYDLLVLPPSFPFGGMENPCLTFTTPTILSGDRSLVSLVAHELAHSWSGNLVTNATWSDFWLNEGFTVYVERRVLEKLYGPARAEMEAVLGRRELDREMAGLPESDRALHVDLAGRDPDDGCTLAPYEKGSLLLRTLEQAVGRDRFDAFLRAYFDHFAFRSITTADFLEYLRSELPTTVPVDEWIFQPGIPAGAAEPHSDAFTRVESGWPAGVPDWSTHEWLHFLRSQNPPDMPRLDREFHFTQSGNSEILHQWLLMAVENGYAPAYPKVEEFLASVGRRKFLKPIYSELMKTSDGRERARKVYARARSTYHPIAQATLDTIVTMDSLQSRLTYAPHDLQFGTSGRRGKVVDLTQLEVYTNALAELEYLQSLAVSEGGIVRGDEFFFARDLRPSSDSFVPEQDGRGEIAQTIVAAIRDTGMRPVNLGQIPTPALACYALARQKGSIMVTGSHIPFDRNGYKTNSSLGELTKEQEAPINEQVRQVRRRLYDQPFDQSPFNERGFFKTGSQTLPAEQSSARAAWVERFTAFFKGASLEGRRLLVYQHSAVGRDLLVEILERMGAQVIPAGRMETFVPIDTENIGDPELAVIQALADEATARRGALDAIVSTDGDSDRPLILGVDPATGKAHFFGGDLVGMVVAEYLKADAVVVPVTCNDAVDRGNLASVVQPKTRIGSPFVIAGMEAARRAGKQRVCGWEPNGGFLTGSDIERNGTILTALLTRDAYLPILGVLMAAAGSNLSLPDLFGRLPKRFSRAALLKQFPRPVGLKIVATLTDPRRLATFFPPAMGFGTIARVDCTDGLRVLFDNGDVAHVRPSGNADELRIYAVADSQARADAIVAMGIAEPDGILRSLENAVT